MENQTTSKRSIKKNTCGCECCAKICARYKKVHPIFASVVFIIVIAASFGILAVVAKNQASDIANLKTQISEMQCAATQNSIRDSGVSYDGQNDKTALELLKDNHLVETKDFSGMGEFVTAIDGVAAEDGKNFWAFYVDGEMAMEGAGTYKTKDGEKIEWRLEEIQ
ncbi:DUF4430 domain-containing protein [Candidatus Saccharibacteria bacterium]|nr:DUF4430 domain-containing protein [Candidatus Saccharibacteria bacterium]